MEEKYSYYTPDIEEFHVGFEYEEDFMSGEGDWRKVTFEVKDDDLWHIPGKLEEGWIRVRHLCHEDIVAEGWRHIDIHHTLGGTLYNLGTFWVGALGTDVTISMTQFSHHAVFVGTIRNRSELRRVMKMVGIEK